MNIKRIVNFVVDDSGQDLVEYAVTTGMVTVTSLLAAVLLGLYLGAAYSTRRPECRRLGAVRARRRLSVTTMSVIHSPLSRSPSVGVRVRSAVRGAFRTG